MAFHWQTFQTRALSAIVFVALMAAGLLWNEWSFIILFFIIHFGCWREYYLLIQKILPVDTRAGKELQIYFILIGCGLLLFSILPFEAAGQWNSECGYDRILFQFIGSNIFVISALLLILRSIYFRKLISGRFLLAMIGGLFYISLSLALLVKLRTGFDYKIETHALVIPLLIIITNWINDTMAYIVGSFIGKTPFSSISPKKTWEGTIGGWLLAIVTISMIAYFGNFLPVGHAAALAAICAISGAYGDLFESKLKRMAGVKDSGTMMPGHGGFLDRFDSLLFSATAGAIYVAFSNLHG